MIKVIVCILTNLYIYSIIKNNMKVDSFIQMSIGNQIKTIKDFRDKSNCPFFIERLDTAIVKNNIACLLFLDDRLIKIFHELKNTSNV